MKTHALIDLYFPIAAASPDELATKGSAIGLDAIIYAANSPDELPDPDTIAELNSVHACQLYPACTIEGQDFRLAILVEDWADTSFEALEAADDLELILAAVGELNGVAVPVAPHQTLHGEINPNIRLSATQTVGVVARIFGGSMLGEDLDIEDTCRAKRRVLAGTGPFGTLDALGRYFTQLPADPKNLAQIISRLTEGYGVAVEVAQADEQARPNHKRRRSRSRRRGKSNRNKSSD